MVREIKIKREREIYSRSVSLKGNPVQVITCIPQPMTVQGVIYL